MSQQILPKASSSADSIPGMWSGFLYVLLGRLRLYFSLVEESLRGEYVYKEETVKDWSKTLCLLDESFFPIYQLLHQSAPSPELVSLTSRRVIGLRQKLAQCKQSLELGDVSAVEKLFSLLYSLGEIRRLIVSWQQELAELEPSISTHELASSMPDAADLSLARLALQHLKLNLSHARRSLENIDEDATCMALRRAYFLIYYLAIVHPKEWEEAFHKQVEELHHKALESFPSGSLASQRIHDRYRKLQQYDLRTLQEYAAQLAH